MKLPALPGCRLTGIAGNQFQATVMGEVLTDELSDGGSTPLRSTTACFDEHLSIKVFKTRIYLICGFRNPYEAESEKWQNTYQLSIGGVRKWVKTSRNCLIRSVSSMLLPLNDFKTARVVKYLGMIFPDQFLFNVITGNAVNLDPVDFPVSEDDPVFH